MNYRMDILNSFNLFVDSEELTNGRGDEFSNENELRCRRRRRRHRCRHCRQRQQKQQCLNF